MLDSGVIIMTSTAMDCAGKPLPQIESSFTGAFETFGKGTLNEVLPATYRDRPAALGTVMAMAVKWLDKKDGPLIWCQLREPERLHLHAPGLSAFGVDPARILKITLQSEKDLLWAMEEALTSNAIAAVVGILWSEKLYGFTASKRLRMRAKESRIPAVMIRSHRANGTSAADMRFSVTSQSSTAAFQGKYNRTRPGHPEWRLNLVKSRSFRPGTYHARWNHETLCLNLAARLAGRAPVPPYWSALPIRPAPVLRRFG